MVENANFMGMSVQEDCELIKDKNHGSIIYFIIPESASHTVGIKKKCADWIKFIQSIVDVELQLKRCC